MKAPPMKSSVDSHGRFTPPDDAELAKESLGEKIRMAIDRLPPEGVTLAEIRDVFGQDGLMLLTIFLTIPFMVPVSIPGVSTVFGSAILLIGVCRLLGRQLWLPPRYARRVLSTEKLRPALIRGLTLLCRLERLTRPHRLQRLTFNGLTNGSLILGAVLLMAPFGLVPFSNTLPGLALLLLALGVLERDGACLLLGHLANLATIIYFGVLIAGGSVLVQEVVQRFTGSAS